MRDYVEKNERLNEINKDYQITDKLDEEAAKLPSRIGGAAGVLRDIGFGIVNGIFAFVTIMVLAAFMLSGGPGLAPPRAGLDAARPRAAHGPGPRPHVARGRAAT